MQGLLSQHSGPEGCCCCRCTRPCAAAEEAGWLRNHQSAWSRGLCWEGVVGLCWFGTGRLFFTVACFCAWGSSTSLWRRVLRVHPCASVQTSAWSGCAFLVTASFRLLSCGFGRHASCASQACVQAGASDHTAAGLSQTGRNVLVESVRRALGVSQVRAGHRKQAATSVRWCV